MRYSILIERAGSNYSAYVPDVPGCIATGQSIAEVQIEIHRAIRFDLEKSHTEDTLPPPQHTDEV